MAAIAATVPIEQGQITIPRDGADPGPTLDAISYLMRYLYDYGTSAVGVVVENEKGQVVLCRVPRYTSMTNQWSVPAGGVEKGEDVLESARREVWEETGFESFDHRLVYTYYPQQGSSNKLFQIVFCRAGERTGNFDPNEISEVGWFSRDEVEGIIARGEMQDGLGLTALLLWLRG